MAKKAKKLELPKKTYRGKRGRGLGDPKVANACIRRQKALEMRRQGATYQEIADAIGMHRSDAWVMVIQQIALVAEQNKELTDQLRRKEFAITDELLDYWLPMAVEGNEKATKIVLSVLERRARYAGLDAPSKIDANIVSENSFRFVPRDQMKDVVMKRIEALHAHPPTNGKADNGSSK